MAVEEALGQDYVLHEEIGHGATGVVRRATRRDGGPPLAAKVLRAALAGDRKVRNLFLQEEAVLRSLDNDAIVAIREVVFDRGRLALLMELVDGPNLRIYLAGRGGTLPPQEACDLAAQVATGLAAAHAQGVVHLDLKPENILVVQHAQPPTLKIADFGLAALLLDAGREQPASVAGTPGYIAPEMLAGGVPTAAADVFALGVVLVEILTGARPQPGLGVPEPLRAFVDACLSADPRARPTARAAAARLRETAPTLAGIPASRPVAGPAAGSIVGSSVPTGFGHPTRLRNSDPRPGPVSAGPAEAAGPARRGGRLAGLRSVRPLIAVLAGLVVFTALALGATVIYRNVAGDHEPDPDPPPPATSAPAFAATYAGRVNGGGPTIAVAVRAGEAVAYVCDGRHIEAWLSGTAVNGKLNLTGRGQASLTGVHDENAAAGTATVGGRRWQFRAPVVLPPSGLYRATTTVRNAEVIGGWIVLADGTQVGVVTTGDEPQPAPSLDTERRTTTIDGSQVSAAQVDGTTDVGS
jgi:hypothetical protein